MIILFLF